jgi:hypothetical protein
VIRLWRSRPGKTPSMGYQTRHYLYNTETHYCDVGSREVDGPLWVASGSGRVLR